MESQKLATDLQIADKVIFTGIRKDTARLLQAMDVFVLPSISEGFSVSALEAESVGLPCVLSKGVPTDVKLFPQMQTIFLPVENVDEWVRQLRQLKGCGKTCWADEIRQTMYDVNNGAKQLMEYYMEKSRSLE
ncbi:hypothetical protein B5E43_05330 [Flavonifractor sp. An100]|nr:hypothetical protein B5E43_05330 [Flavonifractor sp. An100]